ncbi:MAG: tetraacyldisaccharide 4'-kinase [Steroidobacteraceae bacterium]
MSARLQSLWYRPTPPPLALRPLSSLFDLAVRARRAAYARGWLHSTRLARPVIVVGNLTVGGSGKTPLVIWLVAQLRAAGFVPGVVLRGYGGNAARRQQSLLVEPDSDPAEVGDEALLLRRRTGGAVAVGRQRVQAARLLLEHGADVIVADDGLQHLALARDFELAVVDGDRGFGNGFLLPAGPLRERPERLASVDAVVINGADGGWRGRSAAAGSTFTMRLQGERLQPVDGAAAELPLASFAGRRVHAVAGIGNPRRFFAQLHAAGLELREHAFPDHHRFRSGELDFGDALPVLMTEKDAVKCRGLGIARGWYLPVDACFEPTESAALITRVRQAVVEARNRSGSGD